MELQCRKCNGMIGWWHIETEETKSLNGRKRLLHFQHEPGSDAKLHGSEQMKSGNVR